MSRVFLDYYKAREEAVRRGLIEAEYGDYNKYVSYCCWNKTGEQNGEYDVEVYYVWTDEGKPTTAPWLGDWYRDTFGVAKLGLEA